MADKEEVLLDFPNDSNFGQQLEADLQIIYSKYCRAFDGAEEILLSAYTDKDDETLERLFVTEETEYSCDSESDDDSVASGPTCKANTIQDSLLELEGKDGGCGSNDKTNEKKATSLCVELEDLDCNEDFPLPVAESTRSDLTSEVLYTIQNARESGQILMLPTRSSILNQKEEDSGFVKPAEAANCFSSSEFVNDTQNAYPTLPQKSTNVTLCKDISRRRMFNDKEAINSTPENNDFAAVVLQTRNRIASALAEIHQLDPQGNRFSWQKSREVFSLKWTPSTSRKSIKLLSGNNCKITKDGCDTPSIPRLLSPACLKERILIRSKVRIATDSKSGLLRVSCSPRSSRVCQDNQKSSKKKQSIKLLTNRALKSLEQGYYGQEMSPVGSSVALNRPESPSVNSVKLPCTTSLASLERCTPKIEEKMSGSTNRQFPLSDRKTGLVVHEGLSKNSHGRKRTADDVSDSAYGTLKKICRSGDKLESLSKNTDNATSQLRCKGPGKCVKPFCFQCAHTF